MSIDATVRHPEWPPTGSARSTRGGRTVSFPFFVFLNILFINFQWISNSHWPFWTFRLPNNSRPIPHIKFGILCKAYVLSIFYGKERWCNQTLFFFVIFLLNCFQISAAASKLLVANDTLRRTLALRSNFASQALPRADQPCKRCARGFMNGLIRTYSRRECQLW